MAKGFSSTSVDEICEKAGVTKGSFYHYFKTKEDLGVRVLFKVEEEGARVLADGPYQELTDPVEHALGYLQHVEANSQKLWKDGCLLGTFALDLADTNDRIQKEVSEHFTHFTKMQAGILAPLADAMPGADAPTAMELAEQFLGAIEGAIVLAKAHRDPERISTAIRHFRRYVEKLLPPAPAHA